ncbi:MAG: manganese efflux pump MntP family protein [Thermodesulfobacteriota bacterium]
MALTTILLIALALAVDAFAVALAAGCVLRRVTFRHTFRLAWHFGLFQAGMNVIGWGCGLTFRRYIEAFDHWIAFALLALVGGRMIVEALKGEEERQCPDPTRGRTLVVLAVATSIDSLAVGLSFSLLQISIWLPALIIGVTALALTAAGIHLGRMATSAARLGSRVEIGGGLVLIIIGMRILFEHGVFS